MAGTLLAPRTPATGRGIASSRLLRGVTVAPDPPVSPPDPAPTFVVVPTLAGRTENTLTLTWTASQPCQSYAQWGPTGVYGFEGAHENSYDYTTHIQTFSGLEAGTTYHFRVWINNQNGQGIWSGDYTFTTVAATVPDAITYTSTHRVPTGAGWTDGSDMASAFQTWLAGIPQGTDALNQVKVIFTAGFDYHHWTGLKYTNRLWTCFEGEGSPQFVTEPGSGLILLAGNTGGARLINHVTSSAGLTALQSSFVTGDGPLGSAARARGITWQNLQFLGMMSASIDKTSTMASGGSEYAAAIDMRGVDKAWVYNCNTYRMLGDAVVLYGASGAVTGQLNYPTGAYQDPLDAKTQDVTISHNWFRSHGRVGIFLAKTAGMVTIVENLFQDAAYAFIDYEPDYWHMTIGNTQVLRNSFTGGCNWAIGNYMPSIQIGRVVSRPSGPSGWHIVGTTEIIGNIWADRHMRNTNGTAVNLGTSPNGSGNMEMDFTFGPIIKDGKITVRDNKRIQYATPGPVVQAYDCVGGIDYGFNVSFITGGSWLTGGRNGTVTVIGANS